MLVFLSGQDVGNKVIPVEEPPVSKYIYNIENRVAILLNP
jgi:hypothetical protein